MTLSDHIQKVLKPNFAAAWEEMGDDYEKEETFALSSIKTLDGEDIFFYVGQTFREDVKNILTTSFKIKI